MARPKQQPRELSHETKIRRLNMLAEDLSNGVNCLAVLHHAASGFPAVDRRLLRLERALAAVMTGDVWSSVAVDERLVQAVERIRVLVPSWQRTGRGATKLKADAKRVLRRLIRLPPRKRDLCSICLEKLPFMGGRGGGGICADCIRMAHKALVESGA